MGLAESKINFTVAALKAVVCPPSGHPKRNGQVFRYDSRVPGLAFRVTENGERSFWLCRRIRGVYKRIRIGRPSGEPGRGVAEEQLSIDQARQRAGELNSRIAKGEDPLVERHELAELAGREVATLKTLWTDYLENYAKLHKRESSWAEDERMYQTYLATLAARPLAGIDEAAVEKLHRTIGAECGHYQANRVLSLLSTMFRKRGKYHGLVKLWTPTAGLQRFEEHSRERILDPEEIGRFWTAIEAEPSATLRDFFKLSLLTGARKSNVLAMRWEDISIDRAEWKIPGEQMKNGHPLRIPLVAQAIDILNQRPDATPFVFPGNRVTPDQVEAVRKRAAVGQSSRLIAQAMGIGQTTVMRAIDPAFTVLPPTHLKDPKKAWARLLARAKIKSLKMHDLRRTWISAQIRAGANPAVVAASAGHRTSATTMKHYAIALGEDVKASVAAGVKAMLPAVPSAAAGNKNAGNAG